MPEKALKPLVNKIKNYNKNGKIKAFGDKEFNKLENRIKKNIRILWDQLIVAADTNSLSDYKSITPHLKNYKEFTQAALNVLRAKNSEIDAKSYGCQIEELAKKMYKNKAMGPREKLICMDNLICNILDPIPLSPPSLVPPKIKILNAKDEKGNPIRKVVVKIKPTIKNLVLQGGGGKGVGYVGMFQAMQKYGQLAYLENVAGTSVGALGAIVVTIAINADEFSNILNDILKGKKKPLTKGKYAADHPINNLITGFGTKALGIVEEVDKITSNQVANFIDNYKKDTNSMGETGISELGRDHPKLTGEEFERLKILSTSFDDSKNRREGDMVTFKDLELLHKIAPDQFKNLTVTGWDSKEKKELYFNAQNTPHMPIAYAARISMSLPLIFLPPVLDLSRFGGKYAGERINDAVELYDGGLGSNAPSEVFIKSTNSIEKNFQQQNSLSCIFDENGAAYRAINKIFGQGFHSGGGIFAKIARAVAWIASANLDKNKRAENKKLDDLGNIMIVNHGKLGTLSLAPNEDQKEAAIMMAEAGTEEWIRQHKNSVAQVEIGMGEDITNETSMQMNMKTAAKQLSTAELELVVLNPEENNDPKEKASSEEEKKLSEQFKDICRSELGKRGSRI
ncbi:MAG: patatin-like phospholipase family protein [Puniceicoccales bacterium]|jgi:predicted acylesterase/phospholipase RssA|nr:patatin-like phospholipase family protein [Puniceicoccales bacterium]